MGTLINLAGQTFGKLTVLRLDGSRKSASGQSTSMWRCHCACGEQAVVSSQNLRTGKTKSCGCGMHRNKGQSLTFPGKPTWLNNIWQSYTRGARERGLAFELTLDQVEGLVSRDCTYCGAEPRNGIDRTDNSLGYTLKNCVPCCSTCNVMKMAMPADKFISHARKIASYVAA